MTHEQKRQVKEALMRYIDNFDTQTEAAEMLDGVSTSTISQINNNNWELLSDRLWHHIARQVGFYCGDWRAGDTSAYLLLRILFGDAQRYAMTYGIAIGHGLGKTFTASQYARENEHILYIAGNEHYNRKSFLSELLITSGESANGTAPEMLKKLTEVIGSKDQPLLIIDDAQKLKDRVLHLVVLLANGLMDKAGIIIMGDDKLRTRIIDGVRLKRTGFNDIYKTIGRRFITLNYLSPGDVAAVCHANGLHDEDVIDYIRDACNNNLHTATGLIDQHMHRQLAA
jgi:hypothetical protein